VRDLKERTLRGGLARLAAQAATFAVRLGSLMVLSRLLGPKEFGLVGMVSAVLAVLHLFKDFGLSTAAVQRADVTKEQFSTLFWINVAVGLFLALVSLAIAPVIVTFYHEPRLLGVTEVLALGFVFNALGIQHSAILQRQMRFTALAVIEVVSLVLSTGIGIAMAALGYGYWALVVMTASSSVVSSAGLWWTSAWMPGRPRKGVGLGSMMRFGGVVTLNGLVMQIAYNLEKVLLGRYWGANALGLYGRAYQLINIPTENLNAAVGGVAFSALSRIQGDPARLRSYFLKGFSLVLALTVPITMISALLAEDLIAVFLGPKWQASVLIFRLLTPTILTFALVNPLGWFLMATARVDRSLRIAFLIAPVVIAGYIVGLPYGPIGVAVGYSGAMLLVLIPVMVWSVYGTELSVADLLSASTRPVLSGVVATGITFVALFYGGGLLAPFTRLVLAGGLALCTYLGMLFCVMKQKEFYMGMIAGLSKRSSFSDEAPVARV
jgi:O-antigen/teichoic acid export membrane protein